MNISKKDQDNKQNNKQFAQQISKLKEKIKQHREEKEKYLNGWKRSKADLENFKKRQRKERQRISQLARKEIILDLLEVIDDFERLEKELSKTGQDKKELSQGVRQIRSKINKLLQKYGVEKIEAIGKEFDPSKHEAVEHVDTKKFETDQVVEEVRTGYKLKDEVLRPSQVKIAS